MEFTIENLNMINNRLAKGESIRTISADLKLNKSTISTTFRKHGYVFSKESKQFDLMPPTVQNENVANNISLTKEGIFNIPTKTKIKVVNKAFNVVMRESLASQLDKLAKEKNYSRNEIINIMCEYCINNMK